MEKLRAETIANVRCCLVIEKNSLDLKRLEADYKTIVGQAIPHKKLGYNTLEEFIRSVDTLTVRKAANGKVLIDAKPDPRSSHIADMVLRQKAPKKKTRRVTNFTTSLNKTPKDPKRWRPVQVVKTVNTTNGSTNGEVDKNKVEVKEKTYHNSPRLAEHTQFVTKKNVNNNQESVKPINAHKHWFGTDFVVSGNASKDLWNFTRFHRLSEPQVNVVERKNKLSRRSEFHCLIKVNNDSDTSYPDDCFDEQSARMCASKKLLEKLLEKYGRTKNQSQLPVSAENVIKERVPQLVGKHFNGVWSWQVEADYKDIYHETLPPGWLKVFESVSSMSVEKLGDKFVLRVCTPGSPVAGTIACDVSVPTSSASFDENGYMKAKITCPVSAGEIWFRQIETTQDSNPFDEMFKHMNEDYNYKYKQHEIKPVPKTKIAVGTFFAAWNTEWHRVRVKEIRADTVLCIFVDLGEDVLVPYENIYPLLRQYASIKVQAFVCRLAGLDDLYEVSHFMDCINDLQGADVTLEAVGDDEEDAQKIFSVVMYDLETGNARNKDLMLSIAMENATYTFDMDPNYEVSHEVVVSCIGEKPSFLYVQLHTPGFHTLLQILTSLESDVSKVSSNLKPVTRENSKGKLYFAKIADDSKYYRVKIIDSPPNFEYAQLLYVDVGNTRVVKMADAKLIPLELLNPLLCKFPPQATLVQLDLKQIPDNLQHKLKELLPVDQNQNVLLRVQSFNDKTPAPRVKIFIPHPDGPQSINELVNNFNNEKPATGKMTPPDSPHNVPSAGILQCPRLPTNKEYYEVKIPFAVNPWNFFVQPLDSALQLKEMMSRLQATFANRHLDPVNLKDIKAGNIYAAKRDNPDGAGAWCRVCVLKTIYPSAIVVFYVDYGYYANLSYQNLFALDKLFLDLPYQAIKAKLAGVKPIQEKWSVEDCRYFEKLVHQREYVSVIITNEKDELYPCDNVLVLKLIDTKTSDRDVLIGDLLIHKKIAKKG